MNPRHTSAPNAKEVRNENGLRCDTNVVRIEPRIIRGMSTSSAYQ